MYIYTNRSTYIHIDVVHVLVHAFVCYYSTMHAINVWFFVGVDVFNFFEILCSTSHAP